MPLFTIILCLLPNKQNRPLSQAQTLPNEENAAVSKPENFLFFGIVLAFPLGLLFFVPAMWLNFSSFYNIYIYYFIYDYMLPFLPLVIVWLFFYKKITAATFKGHNSITVFLGGYLTINNIFSFINYFTNYSGYSLFILPLLRLSLLLALTVIIDLARAGRCSHWFILLSFPLNALLAFIPYLFTVNYNLSAFFLTIIVIAPISILFGWQQGLLPETVYQKLKKNQ